VDYPKAVIEKAKRLEQLLQRIEQGVSLEQACTELGVKVDARRLTVLSKKYEAGDRSWEALLDGRYGHEQKANVEIREWLYERKRHDATATGPQLAKEIGVRFGVHLSSGQINYLLRKRELTRPVGRPSSRKAEEASAEEPRSSSQSVDNAGIFVLEAAKQEMGVSEAIETGLETARQEYQATQPETTLRIVVSETETLWSKLDHLLYLPVMGLRRARDLYYYQGDGLCALYGFTYKYLTVEQFLGQWTR
jgi:transposase